MASSSLLASWWLLCMIALLGWDEASALCLEHQKLLLIKLNQSVSTYNGSLILGYENGRRLLKWDTSKDCCTWPGVVCTKGYVTGLDLSYESILDGLNNSSPLFNLQYLTSLNMAGSGFQWKTGMSSGFERLANLMHLNLSYSYLLGRFPIEISNLTRLVTLDLSHSVFNDVMSDSHVKLSMLVWNLSKLTQLRLDYVKYLGMQESEWSQVLSSSLPLLQVLSLRYCGLSGPIHSSFQNLTSLSMIDLSENYFNIPFPKVFSSFKYLTSLRLAGCGYLGSIPDFLGELKMLSVLDLQRCNFEGSIPNSFTKLTRLTYLDLSWNSNLSGIIPNSIGELKTLSTLDIRRCNLEGSIPSSSAELTRLAYLSLSGNSKLSGKIPSFLGQLPMLSTLDLAQCNLEGSIPESMSNVQSLAYLDLSYNKLSGSIPSFSKSKNLTYLSFGYNQLTGSILDTDWSELSQLVHIDIQNNFLAGSIPSCLFRIPTLKLLNLCGNHFENFTGEPTEIYSFNLEILDLSRNELQGPFPTFIFGLHNLLLLNVDYNNFSGTFRMDLLRQMKNLSTLHLSYNHFSVESGEDLQAFPSIFILGLASCKLKAFPKFLNNNVKFAGLDLSMNQIRGEIPSWIWNILSPQSYLNLSHNHLYISESPVKDLQYCEASLIDLSYNKLHGKIPIFPLAQYLDLSQNLFSSTIFATLNMSALSFLSIANNLLQGSIPESLCDDTLSILDLSSNFLTGILPACLLQTKSLSLLNLKNNTIGGSIPDSFPSICKLHAVVLNGNSLQGTIPKSLKNCGSLEVLDLGNNKLHDAFPCWMGNVSAIRVILLRSNMLLGSILCPGLNISWPSLQILDIAANNFSGKLPSQQLLSFKAMMVNESTSQRNNPQRYIRTKSGPYSYQVFVELTVKGTNLILQKISTYFTLIDVSNNAFEGHVPNEFGYLNDLHVLNISYNGLRGQIPSSLGKMVNLESLDLRKNELSGNVPDQLANLNFLSVLNLSFNDLEGMIPNGGQLQTFSEYSFLHNKGLCGFPLNTSCATKEDEVLKTSSKFEGGVWIAAEVGYALGLGLVIMPLIFWQRWRMRFHESTDRILLKIYNIRPR